MNMKVRTLAASLAVSTVAMFPLAGVAFAHDRDCADFDTQAEAQQAFDSTPGDPERLDEDNDGVACETRPAGSSGGGATNDDDNADDDNDQVTAVPRGGVETGDGSAATDVADPTVIALSAMAALGVGLAAARRAAVGNR